ncbi:MAG: sigma-70 family RNA polymerase sigma factor [Pseudomonadota bacterium]
MTIVAVQRDALDPVRGPDGFRARWSCTVAQDESLTQGPPYGDAVAHPPGARRSPERKEWVDHLRRIHEDKDHQAFAELFAYFAPRVKAFLMKAGADETTAEECAQDVMATLWRKAHMFDPSRATVATWIFTIARNRRIDVIRREKRPEPEALPWGPEEEPQPSDVIELQQERERLSAALARLPAKQRELVEKAYFGDLSHSQIADETGLPLGTIKSRIRLALERLRHEMK